MPININLIYTSVQQQILKDISTSYLDPVQFNSFANQSVVELFNKYSATFQTNGRVTDKISPFLSKNVLTVNEDTGRVDYPTDYVNVIAVRAFDSTALKAAKTACDETDPDDQINYNSIPQIKVKIIDNDKLGDRLTSAVLRPDADHPIVTLYDTYLQAYPIDTGSIIFEYLRKPVTVVWAYTIGSNELEVYDSAHSVDFEFNYQMQNELVFKIAEYFGVSVSDDELIKGSEQLEAKQA